MASQDDRTHPNRAAFPAGVSGPALRAALEASGQTFRTERGPIA